MRSTRRNVRMLPADRLVRRTAVGIAVMTLLLVAALLCIVGFATAAVAIRSTDASIDRSLRDAATAAIAYLELVDVDAVPSQPPSPGVGQTPSATESESESESESGDPEEENEQPGGQVQRATPAPIAPALAPEPTDADGDDQPPAGSDTFFLVLDGEGRLLSNPRRVLLAGLPDPAAASSAATTGEDWRTVSANGVRVRLFTKRVTDTAGGPTALLQSGMVLTLHDVQRDEIVMTILLASLFGLIGSAVVTLLVTRRALAPIRAAFAAERRFVAAASHELRTPVALLRAQAELLTREDLVKPDGRRLVDDVIGESDRLARLVGDLLTLSTGEAGALEVEHRPVEVRSLVADLSRRVDGMARRRGRLIDLVQHAQAEAPQLTVTSDPDRLTQLLLIFIDNAIDHSPDGGTIRLTVAPVSERGHRFVSIGVADQGPGVPLAERERIFEPFATLRGRRRNGDGTGLGLAIARALAAKLGATLRVADALGGGAVFSVQLALTT